jgi:hypothetical protein
MSDDHLEPVENIVEVPAKYPTVITSFSGYSPPFDPVPIVERMLASVPPKYLIGLKEVVLTNTSDLSRKRRRSVTKSRRRKVRIVEARGLYHSAWNGNRAWIEIFVDNTFKNWERGWWLSFRLYREMLLGDVLIHESGHHIHATVQPEFREKEDVADSWKVRLKRLYHREQHPWHRVIVFPFRPLLIALSKAASRYQFKRGWISRGEFEEDLKKPDNFKK